MSHNKEGEEVTTYGRRWSKFDKLVVRVVNLGAKCRTGSYIIKWMSIFFSFVWITSGDIFSMSSVLDKLTFHLYRLFTELTVNHLLSFMTHAMLSTLLILAVIRTCVTYEPSKWPSSPKIVHYSVARDHHFLLSVVVQSMDPWTWMKVK